MRLLPAPVALRAFAAALAALAMLVASLATPAVADPTQEDVERARSAAQQHGAAADRAAQRAAALRLDAGAAQERLDEIEADFALAVEEYNTATVEHEAAVVLVEDARERVAEVEAHIAARSDDVARVVREVYMGQGASSAAALLAAGDAEDLTRKAGYLQRVHGANAATLEGHRAAERVLAVERAELEVAEADAESLAVELAAQAEALEARAASQQDEVEVLLASVSGAESDVAAAREAQSAAEAEAEAAERAIAEREAAEREAAERAAAEREAAERAAAEQAAAEREAADAAAAQEAAPAPAPAPAPAAAPAPRREEPAPSRSRPAAAPAPSAPAPPPASSSRAQVAIAAARSKLGNAYLWGGSGPDRFDCSGLTSWAWAQAGVTIPRTSGAQYAALPKVSRSQLQPGDLLFFGNPIHHVGMYVGGGQMIESPYTGSQVRIVSINRSGYTGAARPGG